MDHSHHKATGDLRLAFFLNIAFTMVEIAGGLWTNSIAILSDAVHDLSDSLSLGSAWYLDHVAQRRRDNRFSYGYVRFSLLGAWTNVTVLVAGSILVLSEAIPRLFRPEQTHAPGMVAFALVGIAVNGVAALRLRGGQSLNARVATWHLAEDVLGWVAVFLVAVTLLFVDLPVLDPLLAILITAYVLYNVIRNMRRTLLLFMQAVPEEIDLGELEQSLSALAHVRSTHHTQVWSMDGAQHVLTSHIVVDSETTKEEVARLREEVSLLCDNYKFSHTTIEVEWGDNQCRMGELPIGK